MIKRFRVTSFNTLLLKKKNFVYSLTDLSFKNTSAKVCVRRHK